MQKMIACATAIVLASVVGSAQMTETLDLTVLRPSNQPSPDSFGPTFSVNKHAKMDSAPLQLNLLGMNRTAYTISEEFEYRLRVTNSGTEPFTIPWEPDWTRVGENGQDPIISVMISVEVGDEPFPAALSVPGSITLYGSLSTPNTLKTLAPGTSVELVIPGKWELSSRPAAKALRATLPRTTKVWAVLSFTRQPMPGRLYGHIVSTPATVTLEP